MIIDKFEQQPREVRVRVIDYSAAFVADDTLDTEAAVVTEVEQVGGTADDSGSPFTITNAIVEDATTLSYYAQGGADGNKYKATFIVDTVQQQKLEYEIIFQIKEV